MSTPHPKAVCPDCGHPDTHSPLSGCLHTQGDTYCTCEATWAAPKTLADAARERDEGMAHAVQGTDPTWEAAAVDAIRHLASMDGHPAFSADEVWDLLAERGAPECREPRALGPIIQAALREGVVHAEGWVASRRRHKSPIVLLVGNL